MNCERCNTRPVTRVITTVTDGQKKAEYLCDTCASHPEARPGPSATLERPCEVCRKREGSIKLTRLRDGYRSVSYICEVCAKRG